ncbi:hypothetical protein WN51_00339 [Melipona quadrifasciata]|uniref:Uncharacterized protein n=1 Tax=Melipona quadrifasciata TaxID=166423 RepID=A0A0N0U520_9HYME|nr:hypothetical protein WN51_00339 [Melipona quadrifasciata]
MEQVVSALLWSDTTHSLMENSLLYFSGEFALVSVFAENKNGYFIFKRDNIRYLTKTWIKCLVNCIILEIEDNLTSLFLFVRIIFFHPIFLFW